MRLAIIISTLIASIYAAPITTVENSTIVRRQIESNDIAARQPKKSTPPAHLPGTFSGPQSQVVPSVNNPVITITKTVVTTDVNGAVTTVTTGTPETDAQKAEDAKYAAHIKVIELQAAKIKADIQAQAFGYKVNVQAELAAAAALKQALIDEGNGFTSPEDQIKALAKSYGI